MEVSTKKWKTMVNSPTNKNAEITMNGEKLAEVTSFKFLGATLPKDVTNTAEVRIHILKWRPQRWQDCAGC
ncbi:hypothetical protein DPMN_133363 [Dreissena polymorpha]|uniref:Uncharacterized protein n=1 Tax=Dreissena polymorpha TaxID=45954 RepID=A0A9D4FVE8_DREPO|nr:hypothetical protein DPMN_133363 [Dreissena polymorpha]